VRSQVGERTDDFTGATAKAVKTLASARVAVIFFTMRMKKTAAVAGDRNTNGGLYSPRRR
jgi:hypothetical protein